MTGVRPRAAVWRYARSCGLLLLPIFAWNVVFVGRLPPALAMSEFWREIPAPLAWVENSCRLVVSVLPFLMPLERTSPRQRTGLAVFAAGTVLYFGAWAGLMFAPRSAWATSPAGFLAPAYTPAVWLLGLAFLGRRLFWGERYRWWMFLVPAAGFIAAHLTHTGIVYARSH